VLRLLCVGRSRPYIAETLFLSENTVRSHVKHIYQKMQVHTRQELLDMVNEAG
jgi:DNA-binding NarL/FixJ family response regulator